MVRQFARSQGRLAKTDALDAVILVAFAKVSKLKPVAPLPDVLYRMKDLHRYRDHLMRERILLINLLEQTHDAAILHLVLDRKTAVEASLSKINQQMVAELSQEPHHTATLALLSSCPGIGNQTAVLLMSFLPELG
jgi:transposase